MGYQTQIKQLSDFTNDYGLQVPEGEEEEDEDDDDEEGSTGSGEDSDESMTDG